MVVSLAFQLNSPPSLTANNAAATSMIKEPGYKNAAAKKLIDAYYSGEKKSFSRKGIPCIFFEKKNENSNVIYFMKLVKRGQNTINS